MFAFAGLGECWRDPGSEVVETGTILYTTPNPVVVHDRMPVILGAEDCNLRLDPGVTDAARAADSLKPFDAWLKKKYPVGLRVNRAENDDPECVRAVPIAGTAPKLF